ncbi:MAG: Hsp20 family protein [Microbacteriaceae bacterium]
MGVGVDSEAISAHYDNGVLSVVVPISSRAKPRKIEIATSAPRESEQASLSS